MSHKQCTCCLASKPIAEFYGFAKAKDGLRPQCKQCMRDYTVRYRKEHREECRLRQQARDRRPDRKTAMRIRLDSNTAEHPERREARRQVELALKHGDLQKQPCFVCGVLRVEAHHPAYSLPLAVTWLCKSHHQQLHSGHLNEIDFAGRP